MGYVLVGLIVFFLCVVAVVVLHKLDVLNDGEGIIPCVILSVVYSILWAITVPLTIIGCIAYFLGSGIANVIKKRQEKKNVSGV